MAIGHVLGLTGDGTTRTKTYLHVTDRKAPYCKDCREPEYDKRRIDRRAFDTDARYCSCHANQRPNSYAGRDQGLPVETFDDQRNQSTRYRSDRYELQYRDCSLGNLCCFRNSQIQKQQSVDHRLETERHYATGENPRNPIKHVVWNERQAAQLEDEEKRLRSVVDGLHQEQGNLRRQQVEYEKSSEALVLHSKINMIEEKLKRDAKRWAVLTIARDVFERTREEFQQERQPALMKSASKYLSELTLGRYASVRAVIGEKEQDLEVVEGEAHTKRANELSRGTAEQLFLAMRFALIEEYAKNAEPMPVVLDDILVNFDPARAKAAYKVIMDLSERFQVIFLTCHPETETMFKSVAPRKKKDREAAMKVIELSGTTAAERLTLVDTA